MDLELFKTPQKTDQNLYYIWLKQSKKYTIQNVKLVNEDFEAGTYTKFSFTDLSKIESIEKLCLESMINNKKDWFPTSTITDDYIINNFFKISENFKIKLREYISFYDLNKNRITSNNFDFKEPLDIVLVLQGIWVQKSKWGMIVQVEQMRQDVNIQESYDFDDNQEDFF